MAKKGHSKKVLGQIVMGRPLPKYSVPSQTQSEDRPDWPLQRLERYRNAQTTDSNN